MSNHTVPATAEGLPADPVVILAKRWADGRQQEAAAEKKCAAALKADDGAPPSFFETAQADAYDEAEAARSMMACTKATSLLGAAAQIADAINRTDILASDTEDRQIQRETRAVHRLLWSALHVIESAIGASVEGAFGWDLASSNTDPWVPLEDRLALAGYILRTEESAR